MIAKIGQGTLDTAQRMIGMMLSAHKTEIEQAWLKTDGPLTINLSLKLSSTEFNDAIVNIDAGISFVLEKIKDSISGSYDERQEGLWDIKGDNQ